MELSALCSVLQGTLSSVQGQRQEAEALLKQHDKTSGQVVNLLRVAAEESVGEDIRLAAAIYFKNCVKRSWIAEREGHYELSEADRLVVRENLMESLIRAPHGIQTQLGEVFRTVVYADFPEKWPALPEPLYTNLVSQEPKRVHGALLCLRILARKYEFRDAEEREPLNPILATTFPVLLHIFKQLLAAPPTQATVPEYTKLVCKTFWSATYMSIPQILLEREQFVGWMSCLHTAITQPVPLEVQPADLNERSASVWWKAKKWVLHTAYRLFNRYGVPKHCKDNKLDRAFADMFTAECSAQFLQAHMGLMASLAAGTYLSPRVTNLVFQYVTYAIQVKPLYKQVAEHWDSMLHNVAFPMMGFDDLDAQLWADDPAEYIRKGYDIMEDMYSPKTAAANFAHELCSKGRSHLDKFMALLLSVFAEHGRAFAEGSVTQVLARRLDAALLAVGCLTDILQRKAPYKDQIGTMLVTYVLPCFDSPYGHVRERANWVAGMYSAVEFPDGQGMGASFQRFFQKVVHCLPDPDLPVRVSAVVALRHFVDTVEEVESLKPILPQLLTSIFGIMDQVDSEDLVCTLESLVEKFGEDIAPYALQMTTQLSTAFWKYVSLDDEDADDAGIAAFGCIRALNTVLQSVAGLTHLFPALEEVLFPIMKQMISTEGQDIFEEVLEMLSYFSFYSETISDRLWSLWPQIHICLKEFAIDYWANILGPLDNYISRSTARFLSSKEPDYQASLFDMVQHSLAGDFNERDIVPAAQAVEVLLQHCKGQVDASLAPYLQVVLARLATAETVVLRDALVVVVANALHYNAPLTLGVLAARGAVASFFTAWFTMIFAVKAGTGKMKHFKRMHDKKVCALGLCSLLASPEEALPLEIRAGLPQVLQGAMRLLMALNAQKEENARNAANGGEEEEEEEDDIDEEDGDADDAEEAGEEEDETSFMKRLHKHARDIIDGKEEADSEEDDEGFFTDDEEMQTPLDEVDPFSAFVDTLTHVCAAQPARYAGLLASLDATGQAAVAGLYEVARKETEERAKAAAAPPS